MVDGCADVLAEPAVHLGEAPMSLALFCRIINSIVAGNVDAVALAASKVMPHAGYWLRQQRNSVAKLMVGS